VFAHPEWLATPDKVCRACQCAWRPAPTSVRDLMYAQWRVRPFTTALELIHRGWHHLHDMKAPLFKVFQQTGQSGDGCGVNVVE
jgi:hypothetical protein